MQTLTKEPIKHDLQPAIVVQNWDLFLPAATEAEDFDNPQDTSAVLRQAETIIRAQEERIRTLEALALSDELTGLVNRRGFNIAFERELTLARRDTGHCGMLAMIDLDGFKLINDKWGHQAGDAYLRAVAQSLQDFVRGSDIVARLGGDEFAVLLTCMDEKDGAKRFAKLEQLFNNRSMIWNDKRLALRASFGISPYAGSDRLDSVMQAADVRLYAHKARNFREKRLAFSPET